MENICTQLKEATLTVSLAGRIDINNVDYIEEVIVRDLKSYVRELVFDFEKVECIFSCGLRLLLNLKKMAHEECQIRIINTNDMVKEIFKVTGYLSILKVE